MALITSKCGQTRQLGLELHLDFALACGEPVDIHTGDELMVNDGDDGE